MIQARQPFFERKLRELVESAVEDALNRYENIEAAIIFAQTLKSTMEDAISRWPVESPGFSTEGVNFKGLYHAEKDWWTALVGRRQEAINQHKVHVIDTFQTVILQHVDLLRRYFGREPVSKVVRALEGWRGRFVTLKDDLKRACTSMEELHAGLVAEPPEGNIRLITRSGAVRTDVEELIAKVWGLPESERRNVIGRACQEDPLVAFLRRNPNEITQRLRRAFREEAFRYIGEVNVFALDRLQDQAVDMAENYSRPYVEFDRRYTPLHISDARLPRLIIGNDRGGHLNQMEEFLNNGRVSHPFQGVHCPLDHMVMFYREEPGFALDDLRVAQQLRDAYTNERVLSDIIRAGRHTHKDGAEFFDIASARARRQMIEQREEVRHDAQKWLTVALELVPEHFQDEHGNLIFEYTPPGGILRPLNLRDPSVLDRLTNPNDPSAYDQFVTLVKDALLSLGQNAVQQRAAERIKQLQQQNQLKAAEEKSDLYNEVLRKVFNPT